MVKSGRVCRVEDLQNIFPKKKEDLVACPPTTLVGEKDDDEEEIVETEEQNRENMEDDEDGDDAHEVSVRVLGTLESFDPTKSLGVLKDDNFALTFDASSVLPTFKWKLKSLYFLIGEYEKREEREDPHSSSSLSILRNGSLRVRIAQNASGLDVNAYHEAAKIREEFLR